MEKHRKKQIKYLKVIKNFLKLKIEMNFKKIIFVK